LDILINNAAIGTGTTGAVNADLNEVRQIMETNFYGPWRLSLALLPMLKKSREGRIINLSSGMCALEDLNGGYAGYRLSKAGLNALTILMANELRGTNLKVNAMCPGWVRTDMGGSGAPRPLEKGAETAVWLATIPDGGPSGLVWPFHNLPR
jgi:NAD(P)-dependent dehydrogenase (short-subunit alcohol dehydrogenase family)